MSDALGPGRESPNVAARTVLYVMLSFLGFVALSLVALRLYFGVNLEAIRSVPPQTFPAPRIETDTPDALQRLLSEQRARLQGYAWVDKQNGVIRIPIERAMELIAARGKDGYAPLEEAPAASASDTQPPRENAP